MKKLIISLLAMAATLNAMALDCTAVAKMKLTSNSGEICDNIYVGETADPNASFYCATMNMTGRKIALYTITDTKQYQKYYTADVEGVALGFKTFTDTEYTITFSNVQGKLYLVDAVEDKFIEITEGGSYAFTAEANTTVTGRFSIAKNLPHTFINNVLVVGEATGDVIVTPFTYGPQGKALGTPVTYPAPVNQVLTSGYFLVSYTTKSGATREFIVNANPDVQPANP